MNIFEELRADHDVQRKLLELLLETTGDHPDRRDNFRALKLQLEAHAAFEEEHFYTLLMTDDMTRDKARHSVSEHKEIDDYLEQLDEYDFGAAQWLITARELADRVRHHLEEEEQEVFQVAGKVFSDDDKTNAAAGYRMAMDERIADETADV